MDYEKKYKDVFAHAREIHRNEEGKRKDMEFLFPELKGIDDEEIKEEIINYFECLNKDKLIRKDIHNKWIDWLKRQGNKPQDEKKKLKEMEQNLAWREKYIADVFEKVGLAKIAREQSNDNLTNALQDAMIELSKFKGGIRV